MVSIAEIPVWIISLGYILDHGLIGCPSKFQTAELVIHSHFQLINWVNCLIHFSLTLNVQKVLSHYGWAFINSLPRAIEYTTCKQKEKSNQNKSNRSSWRVQHDWFDAQTQSKRQNNRNKSKPSQHQTTPFYFGLGIGPIKLCTMRAATLLEITLLLHNHFELTP